VRRLLQLQVLTSGALWYSYNCFEAFKLKSACIEQVPEEHITGSLSLSHPLLDLSEADGTPQIVGRLARFLQKISEEPSQSSEPATDVFASAKSPPISIEAYAQRLHQYMNCSPVCFAYAYVFMQQLVKANLASITTATVHRCVSLHRFCNIILRFCCLFER
jgi:hypothetical protein